MKTEWSILYRGPLTSCNYACTYCPFAKKTNSREELEEDARCLNKFVEWVSSRKETIGILFTPWGEGLIRKHYQEAMLRLSNFPNVRKVAIQTNLSSVPDWTGANKEKLALWTTYHPEQVGRKKFLDACKKLITQNIRFSVGMVGFKEYFKEIIAMRELLPSDIYLWINANKKEEGYYSEDEIKILTEIDSFFPYNLKKHKSLDEECFAGETSFTVDGDGNMYRCHFIKNKTGNIYNGNIESILSPSNCTEQYCGCYIGYKNIKSLDWNNNFGEGHLERIAK